MSEEGLLVLEDGTRAGDGEAIGRRGTSFGEIVFNTAMSGLPGGPDGPVLRGADRRDDGGAHRQLRRPRATRRSRSASTSPASSRATSRTRWSGTGGEESLADYLERAGVDGPPRPRHARARAADPDARARCAPASRRRSTTRRSSSGACSRSPPMLGSDLALSVSPDGAPRSPGGRGRKRVPRRRDRLRDEAQHRAAAERARAAASRSSRRPRRPSEILARRPDGIFLSNGPGDPAALAGPIRTIERLIERASRSSASASATSSSASRSAATTFKLKFGHRGANHPGRGPRARAPSRSRRRTTASPSTPSSLPADVEPTHRNLNDGTLEGFRHRTLPILAAQFHPEAAPGPARRATCSSRVRRGRWSAKGREPEPRRRRRPEAVAVSRSVRRPCRGVAEASRSRSRSLPALAPVAARLLGLAPLDRRHRARRRRARRRDGPPLGLPDARSGRS